MKLKDASVETSFHPILTQALFYIDYYFYQKIGSDLLLTSGSEHTAKHSRTSLHYNVPAQAADFRSWTITYAGEVYTAVDRDWET